MRDAIRLVCERADISAVTPATLVGTGYEGTGQLERDRCSFCWFGGDGGSCCVGVGDVAVLNGSSGSDLLERLAASEAECGQSDDQPE